MIVDKAMLVGVSTVGGAALAASLWVAGWMWVGKRQSDADLNKARAETVETVAFADKICAVFGGARYSPAPGEKAGKRKDWGAACYALALEVWGRDSAAARTTLTVTVDHGKKQTKKRAADAVAARRDDVRDTTAKQELEKAHAGVQNGLYGPEYFGALNRAFGLRRLQDAVPAEPAAPVAAGGGAD